MTRLNFLLIQTDDQGRWAVPWRMPELPMPNLERFARDALELDRFYCASPVCSPSRASVLTGRLPSAHGVHDWLVGARHGDSWPDDYLAGQPTTPEVLARVGYQCAMSGKWHVGDSRRPAPGFEYWYAHRFGGGDYYGAPIWREGEESTEERYFTRAVTQQAVEFLQTRDHSRPFYLQVNYTAPHHPWVDSHLPEYLDKLDGVEFDSVPRLPRHPWAEVRDEFDDAFADPVPQLKGYVASLMAVDEGLGHLLGELEAQGLLENTVVAWFSDNGFSCGHHGIWGKGNGTYPLNFFDNSVRVPCVVRMPGGATGISDELLSAASWHATICELAGVKAPEDGYSVSESFADVLRGRRTSPNEVVAVVSEYGDGRMVTDGQFTLVLRDGGPDELYDGASDPGQTTNRISDPRLASVREHLSRQLDDWFRKGERPGYSGQRRGVSGYGQVHPVSRGVSPERSYVGLGADSLDGTA
ncbi:sulfatase-like hydrolase/transferase [Tessaracoccus defluvii]|uniref:Sulfatase-like hydrolase/transferase n=1 Tax=Tessaracoccus defluvii TaxID=1285901 RepID=A0A7H0H9W2_9ACTN|nr:sulfatase-like hydrolase/transferase [Tessaracoccus defluvii]